MKLKYEKEKGKRIKYKFYGFSAKGLWFIPEEKQWKKLKEISKHKRISSKEECKSVRAFRRKLKKVPKGIECVLENRWKGYNVIGYGSKRK